MQVYGFTCNCPRCLLEASPEWQQQQQDDAENSSSGDWETDSAAAADDDEMLDCDDDHGNCNHHNHHNHHHQAGSSAPDQQQQQQQGDALDPGYLSVFMLKFMCPAADCCGTMAAVEGTDVCECSVCGFTRTEAQFMAELEQQQQ